jgi:hypothetical protein
MKRNWQIVNSYFDMDIISKRFFPLYSLSSNLYLCILQHTHDTSPSLHNSGLNLRGRQGEAIISSIPQLISIRVGRIARHIGVIRAVARSSVQSRASRANGIASSRNTANGSSSARGERAVLRFVFGTEVAVITIGPQNVLAVGVEVDVETNAAGIAELVDLCDKTLVLRGIAGGYALIGLGAGAG